MAAMDVCEGKRDWRPQTVSDVLRMQVSLTPGLPATWAQQAREAVSGEGLKRRLRSVREVRLPTLQWPAATS